MSATPTEAATKRLAIAATVGDELRGGAGVADVWVEGALACGFAHQRSDIDIRLVVADRGRFGRHSRFSRIVDGTRVDVVTYDHADLAAIRSLLGSFDVGLSHLDTFGAVRANIEGLTRYMTAVRIPGPAVAVSSAAERAVYRQWAVAHQAEWIGSLAEDLVGCAEASMLDSAAVVWRQIVVHAALAEIAAAGMPLLGEKWLPILQARLGHRPVSTRFRDIDHGGFATCHLEALFRQLQVVMAEILLSVWPVNATPSPCPARVRGPGWTPHRYSSTWLLRRGDEHVPITGGQMIDWARSLGAGEVSASEGAECG
ncbi:hypothetical protein GCM10009557_17830 [Virgisporangium ochraceum]|uniref:Polymerase nucleotidyl transferase domain-containing protein n=1 Tax=Virgisporangium ochraceum TaxID=65505 RepID=A0A8J4A3I9_9ACTN|nr:hypothetical protein [Virgisporangium ochraceum]GIJ72680.1 hypothetical protein Voc01_075970 [Virgisporangium ochraceum]